MPIALLHIAIKEGIISKYHKFKTPTKVVRTKIKKTRRDLNVMMMTITKDFVDHHFTGDLNV